MCMHTPLMFLNSFLLTNILAMCFGAGLLDWLLIGQMMVDFIPVLSVLLNHIGNETKCRRFRPLFLQYEG